MRTYLGVKGHNLNLLALFAVMMPSFVSFGYNLSVGGGLMTLSAYYNQFPVLNTITTTGAKKHYNSTILGTVTSIVVVGGMLGAISTSFIGDVFGRRKMVFVASVITMIGAIVASSSFSLAQLIVGRVVVGFGIGMVSGTVPVYQTEISNTKNRGIHVACTGIFIAIGILLGFWVDYGCSYLQTSASWRVPFALQIGWSLMTMSFIFFLPESPTWLIKKGRCTEAKDILMDFGGSEQEVDEHIAATKASLDLLKKVNTWDVWKMGESRVLHRVLLSLFIMFTQQICGILAITSYTPTIFNRLGMSVKLGSLISSCIDLCQPLGAILAVLTVDKLGRRKPFLIAGIGMGVGMVLLAGNASQLDNKESLHATIAWLIVVNFAWSYGFLGLSFVYASEILPIGACSAVGGLSLFVNWATTFLVVEVAPVGFDSIAYKYYIVYACTNLFLIVPVIYFFFPETSGKSLEQIEMIFLKSNGFLDAVRISQNMHDEHSVITPGDYEKDEEESYSERSTARSEPNLSS